MDLKIRPAAKDDCKSISGLTNQLGYPSSFEKVCEIMDTVIKHDDHQIYIAEMDNNIVGYIHLVCSYRLSSEPFVEIAAIMLDESCRKRGIGNGFLSQAEEWARGKNYHYLRIRNSLISEESQNFFIKKGFRNQEPQDVLIKDINVLG